MPLSPSTIVTDRLTLTPLVREDAEAMFDVVDDERMHEFTGGRPLTLAELRTRYERLAVGHSDDRTELWFNWVVRITEAETPVGVMQATVSSDGSTADVAWEIGVPWQGRGMASEAANAMVQWLIAHGIRDLQALIHPDHVASARVAGRAGLSRTSERVEGEVMWRRLVDEEP